MEVPPNAHIDVFGSGWECDQGFRRVGNGCEPVEVPPNAHIDVFGSGWECDQGFRRVGNGCEPVEVPPNAHIDVFGSGWECDQGFRRVGNGCEPVEVPPNAHIDVFGSGWECDQGFRRVGNGCEPVEVPPNAHIDVFGSGWECDQGFRRVGNGCEPVEVPPNAHIDVFGSGWECDQGFRRVGNECVLMTAAELQQQAAQRSTIQRMLSSRQTGQAYETRIESDRNDVLFLENGGVVEVSGRHLGYVGYRKHAVLFPDGTRWRIWIEGKGVYRCGILQQPTTRRGTQVERAFISDVSQGGDVVILGDGSVYEVDPIDTIYTTLWLAASEVLLLGGSRMINIDDGGEIIGVTRLR